MKTLRDIETKNKIILVRVDFNVPVENGKVVDDFRIRAALPTIEHLQKSGAAKIFLISHLGRPEGGLTPENLKNFSLQPVFETLKKLLPETKIGFSPLPTEEKQTQDFSQCDLVLLENLRFDSGEEKNDPNFAQKLVDFTGAEIFIQDGFAVAHRAHASTVALAKILPTFAGFLLEKEIKNLDQISQHPESPSLLILGGAKVADKTPLIKKILPKMDKVFIGGKIAADSRPEILELKSQNPEKIYIAEDFDENSNGEKLDIGPVSTAELAHQIETAKTIIWNGLLGKAEDPAYSTSSTIAAELLGRSPQKTTIILGGDTTAFVSGLSKTHKLEYALLSTGGGAALAYLSGEKMPALDAINS